MADAVGRIRITKASSADRTAIKLLHRATLEVEYDEPFYDMLWFSPRTAVLVATVDAATASSMPRPAASSASEPQGMAGMPVAPLLELPDPPVSDSGRVVLGFCTIMIDPYRERRERDEMDPLLCIGRTMWKLAVAVAARLPCWGPANDADDSETDREGDDVEAYPGTQQQDASEAASARLRRRNQQSDSAASRSSSSSAGTVMGFVGRDDVTALRKALDETSACIMTLGVHPTARRRGLARELVQAATAVAAGELGGEWATLHCLTSNTRALQLYKGLGFAVTRSRRGYYWIDGRSFDAVELRAWLPLAGGGGGGSGTAGAREGTAEQVGEGRAPPKDAV